MNRRPLVFWARAFAIGSLVHLTLPDVRQEGWLLPALVEAVGAVWLLIRPGRFAFALCALGTLAPLLWLRDVLTQSALLSLWALIAAIGWSRPHAVRDAVAATTGLTYLLAALHKLNTTFLDPAYSCANHAWAQVEARYGLSGTLPADALPALAIALEVAVGLAVLRRSRWLWPLGLAFHLPLTVTLAPAFGPVMVVGWVAAMSDRQRVRWRRAWRRGRSAVLASVVIGALVEAWASGGADPWASVKTGAAAGLLVLSLMAARRDRRRPLRWTPGVVVAALVWVVNGLTPYAGVQYQHAAAMLSNLRIDTGCHNSLIMPERLRLADPYIRIDRAEIGSGQRPRREAILRETLWSLPALHTMHRNWCVPENRPIRLEGRWRDSPFVIPDLCARGWPARLPEQTSLPGFQRFQKNLARECPTACVH